VIDVAEGRRLWRSHQSGLRWQEPMIWAVLMLEQWGRNFLNGAADAAPASVQDAPTWTQPEGVRP
jgi:asparagine synthase (glutamine-hydrolysing)